MESLATARKDYPISKSEEFSTNFAGLVAIAQDGELDLVISLSGVASLG